MFQITLMVSPLNGSITPMPHDRSTRHRPVAAVVNPSTKAAGTSLVVVVVGPLVAMVAYTHPMLLVGGVLGILARPAVRVAQRAVHRVSHLVGHYTDESQGAATRAPVDASAE